MTDIYLLNGARTPIGSFLGSLSSFSASELGAHSIKHTIEKNKIELTDVDEVFIGQVVQLAQDKHQQDRLQLKRDYLHRFLVAQLIRFVAQV